MADPLFGTAAPIWSAVPFPVPPFASPLVAGVPTSSPLPGEPYAFNRGVVPEGAAPGFGAGSSNFVSIPVSAPFAPFGNPGIAVGVTAPALVSAMALRRGQPAGPTNDQEIEDFIYDALDLFPGASDVEVRCDGGRASLMGAVAQKRLKRDIGEIAWAIPGISDVQNNITIVPRRRSRAQSRDTEPSSVVAARKPA